MDKTNTYKKTRDFSLLINQCFDTIDFSKLEKELKDIDVSPSDGVITNIINYSKALNIHKTTATGNINLILN